jgi:hypothetical protein
MRCSWAGTRRARTHACSGRAACRRAWSLWRAALMPPPHLRPPSRHRAYTHSWLWTRCLTHTPPSHGLVALTLSEAPAAHRRPPRLCLRRRPCTHADAPRVVGLPAPHPCVRVRSRTHQWDFSRARSSRYMTPAEACDWIPELSASSEIRAAAMRAWTLLVFCSSLTSSRSV